MKPSAGRCNACGPTGNGRNPGLRVLIRTTHENKVPLSHTRGRVAASRLGLRLSGVSVVEPSGPARPPSLERREAITPAPKRAGPAGARAQGRRVLWAVTRGYTGHAP